MATGETRRSDAAFRQALRLPDKIGIPTTAHTSAHNNLGLVLQQQGKLNEAITEYKRAIALDPYFVTPQNNLQEVQRQIYAPGITIVVKAFTLEEMLLVACA